MDRIFSGSLTDLPPVSSKIVRIFTSSTFTDMLMERNTLMEWVYPKIKEYCREKHGLEFQVPYSRQAVFTFLSAVCLLSESKIVDMRWGVCDEMTNEHMITCLFTLHQLFVYFLSAFCLPFSSAVCLLLGSGHEMGCS